MGLASSQRMQTKPPLTRSLRGSCPRAQGQQPAPRRQPPLSARSRRLRRRTLRPPLSRAQIRAPRAAQVQALQQRPRRRPLSPCRQAQVGLRLRSRAVCGRPRNWIRTRPRQRRQLLAILLLCREAPRELPLPWMMAHGRAPLCPTSPGAATSLPDPSPRSSLAASSLPRLCFRSRGLCPCALCCQHMGEASTRAGTTLWISSRPGTARSAPSAPGQPP
mmetsp:Transcript_8090/g.19359  ORF Transcript_8090/g.19359 Transcript_8090/m.19359 type:complete len:219 (+) Transcript_8090:853-1509(+)